MKLMKEYHYVPFACRDIGPGDVETFALDFDRPFAFGGLVADDDDAEGLVVEDVIAGERSLVVTECTLYEGEWPLSFRDVVVPARVPLRVRVRNPTAKVRSFSAMVWEEVDLRDATHGRGPQARRRESLFWTIVVAPSLKLVAVVRDVFGRFFSRRGG